MDIVHLRHELYELPFVFARAESGRENFYGVLHNRRTVQKIFEKNENTS